MFSFYIQTFNWYFDWSTVFIKNSYWNCVLKIIGVSDVYAFYDIDAKIFSESFGEKKIPARFRI